jgi:predicted hotdog family 3-hydroxylacyl-ACP dehydratase
MTESALASLIPHQGSMCLLEQVIDWNEHGIRLATATHRSPGNPLRSHGRLRAIHLCEYGAQAMAVHGALLAQSRGGRAPPGMLVALRSIAFHCEHVDDIPGDLLIEARCLQADATSQQYSFRISHAGTELATGRAAVMLRG